LIEKILVNIQQRLTDNNTTNSNNLNIKKTSIDSNKKMYNHII